MESYGIVVIMQSYGKSTLKVIQPIVWHHLAIVGYASQHKVVHNGSQPGDTMGILYIIYVYYTWPAHYARYRWDEPPVQVSNLCSTV